MASKDETLTTEWKQVTDGTQSVSIQVISGTAWFRDSPTKPANNVQGHQVPSPRWLGVTPPQQMWGRSSGGEAKIIIT